MASTKKKPEKKPEKRKKEGAAAAGGPTEAGADEPMDIAQVMSSTAAKLAKEGSVRVRGLGKFSIRATQSRKGVRRRVVLRVAPEFQAQLDAGAAPEGGAAGALVEALKGGESLRVAGLGTFELTDQPATTNVHPRTRKSVIVPARRVLTFKGATLGK